MSVDPTAEYELIDGVRCYAPELAARSGDFPPEFFERLFQLEARNFWFRARNRLIRFFFRRYLIDRGEARVLELGCGTGYVLLGLSTLPNLKLLGAEVHVDGLRFARNRLPAVEFLQVDATRLPFEADFDAVGAFDVLEHIEEDSLVMRNVRRALKPGGLFFISVPQHPFLWSSSDDMACHKRRYRRGELVDKLRRSGFDVVRVTSFVFTLFPAMAAERWLHRKAATQTDATEALVRELSLPWLLNAVFTALMMGDEALIRLGLSLPWGGSLMLVARRGVDP